MVDVLGQQGDHLGQSLELARSVGICDLSKDTDHLIASGAKTDKGIVQVFVFVELNLRHVRSKSRKNSESLLDGGSRTMANELAKNLFDDISKAVILLFVYGIDPTFLFRELGPPGPLLDSFQE